MKQKNVVKIQLTSPIPAFFHKLFYGMQSFKTEFLVCVDQYHCVNKINIKVRPEEEMPFNS